MRPALQLSGGGHFESLGSIEVGIGDGASGRAEIIEGGTVKATREQQFSGEVLTLGNGNAANGTVLVDGAGSRVDVTEGILVAFGTNSTGDLTISNGGVASIHSNGTNENFSGMVKIGTRTGASGSVTVTGNGSRLETGGILMGDIFGGQAQRHIENGGTVTVDEIGALTSFGRRGGSVGGGGLINITGAGSKLQISPYLPDNFSFGSGELTIGGRATGTVTVDNNGLLDMTGANIDLGIPVSGFSDLGLLNVRNGGTVNANTITVGQFGTLTGGNGTINANVVVNGGTVAPGNSPGTMTINGNADLTNGSLEFQITQTAMDLLVVTGDLTLGDNFILSLLFDFDPIDYVLNLDDLFNVSGLFTTTQNFNLFDNLTISSPSNISNLTVNFQSTQRILGNTSPASVPEPAPFALLGFGLLGLGFMRKRRG